MGASRKDSREKGIRRSEGCKSTVDDSPKLGCKNGSTKDSNRIIMDISNGSTKDISTKNISTKDRSSKDTSSKDVSTNNRSTKNINGSTKISTKDPSTKDTSTKDISTKDTSTKDNNRIPTTEPSKKYKRSDSKTNKKMEIKRSSPKTEYILTDATAQEKELITHGTITDKINCLALLCARNPSADNYKQLLQFAENQRNDVIYLVLKNVRDLIKEHQVSDQYIKNRIIKSFEMGAKNQYIKDHVIEILGVLIRAGIYPEELISVVVERMLEKDNTLKLVEGVLRSTVLRHEELIIANLEDFYYKNDNFRVQYLILRFLSTVEFPVPQNLFDFYNQALTTLDPDYPEAQHTLMLDLIINGLCASATADKTIERIDVIRNYVGSPKTVISCLRLLVRINDPYRDAYVLKAIKSSIIRNTKYECDFLNIVSGIKNPELISKLVNNCFYYSPQYIIAIIMIASEMGLKSSGLYAMLILARHYHPAVRDVAFKLLRSEQIRLYDPYDHVLLETMVGNTK